jgi:glutathione S-transferase
VKLYVFPFATYNASKVLLAAEEMRLAYEVVKVDVLKRENREPEHLARHPLGKIPVLEDGHRTLIESMAIIEYLQTLGKTSLSGDDVHDTRQWAQYVNEGPGRAVGVLFRQEIILQKMNGIAADAKAVAKAVKQLDREWAPVEARLESRRWLGGADYSVADIVMLAYLLALADTSYSIEPFVNLCGWYARATARPSFARAMAHFS